MIELSIHNLINRPIRWQCHDSIGDLTSECRIELSILNLISDAATCQGNLKNNAASGPTQRNAD